MIDGGSYGAAFEHGVGPQPAPPHEVRYFVHKKLIRLATKVVVPAITSLVPGGPLVTRLATSLVSRQVPSVAARGLSPACIFRTPQAQARAVARWLGGVSNSPAFRRELLDCGILPPTAIAPPRQIVQTAAPCPKRGEQMLPDGTCGNLSAFRARTASRSKQPMRHRPSVIDIISAAFKPGPGPCTPPEVKVGDKCVNLAAAFPGGQPFLTPVGNIGEPIMGRYGAGYVPGSLEVSRAVCLPGDVVGNDGICYPKRSIKNSDRQWPRGRRPLLTGGEMRAISIAARAAGKFQRTQKRLERMGMIKKPARAQRIKLPPHQHQITSGS